MLDTINDAEELITQIIEYGVNNVPARISIMGDHSHHWWMTEKEEATLDAAVDCLRAHQRRLHTELGKEPTPPETAKNGA